MIELDCVRKIFHQGRPNESVALHGITLSIEAEKVTVFKGPSGSGKTTLLSLIGCMSKPTSGRIRLMGREITSLPERFLTEIRRKRFGFIFQHLNLIHGVSALENAMLPAYPTGQSFSAIEARAKSLFELFDILEKSHAPAEWLSGGEAQRVAIARALINDPLFVIADEPTAHLDSKLSREFMEMVERMKAGRKTVLIASHDPLVFDAAVVDRIVDVRDGRIEGRA